MASVERDGYVAEIRCDSAGEFLETLSPLSGIFAYGYAVNDFVYRGVRSEAFTLIPSAYRQHAELLVRGEYRRAPLPTAVEQCIGELQTVRRFFEIAASHGVRLPEDSSILRSRLDQWEELLVYDFASTQTPVVWPPPDFYSLFGLAQHYGIPTRALDWTMSSLTAAYFAALGAQEDVNDSLVVWAFYRAAERTLTGSRSLNVHRPLVVFTASGADNENLRAQRGLFMLQSQILHDPLEPFVASRFDDLMLQSFPDAAVPVLLYKITVPTRESRTVLAALNSAGVTAGALFPGLWGSAREYHERRIATKYAGSVPQSSSAARVIQQLRELEVWIE